MTRQLNQTDLTFDSPTGTEWSTITQDWSTSSGNDAPANWVPPRFVRLSITESVSEDSDEAWADLAAQARATWARENPF